MSIQDDTQMQDLWGDLDLDTAFSENISDDFLVADGLDDNKSTETFEFDALTVFDESNIFEHCSQHLPTSEKTVQVHPDDDNIKKLRRDRSRSPSPKRRKSIAPMLVSPSPVKPCATMSMSPSSIKDCETPSLTSLHDLEIQYKLALEKLTISMRRSEMTRCEIISFRKEAKANRELCQERETPSYATPSGLLLTRYSHPTLTIGVEQSRHMLRDYINTLQNSPDF